MKRLVLLLLAGALVCASAFGSPPKTVVIDPGHGGHDKGGIPRQKACEKTLALDVAQRLRILLNEQGVKTVMTRNDDTFIPLSRRVAIANAHRAALFVSIHFNSAFRKGANGFETFYYSRKSAGIAARVNANLRQVRDGDKRGVKRRPYYVLRKAHGPAVLVECGFLTNPTEAALCSQPRYRQKLAQAIARGIMKN